MSQEPEFSRPVRADTIAAAPREMAVEADEAERAALSRRFGLVAIHRLAADARLSRSGETIMAEGRLHAAVTQSCVATAAPVEAALDEPFRILFRPHPTPAAEDEIELDAGELDVVFYDGAAIDLGEAIAETLSLSLDPWPRVANADEALKAAGVKDESEVGPFAALAGLKDKIGK
jgi:uncharacterized metal-binding protein YceD (DUF177 family)